VDLQFLLFLCRFPYTRLIHSWPVARNSPVGAMDSVVICKISDMLTSPLKNFRHLTASTCYVCRTFMIWNYLFSKMYAYARCYVPCYGAHYVIKVPILGSWQLQLHTLYVYKSIRYITYINVCTHHTRTGSRCTLCVHGLATGLLRNKFRFILHLTIANHKSLQL
jgi:hypothetical protein